VLIAGAGPIGVLTAQAARAFGAVEVIVSAPSAERRRLAEGFGATRTVDPADDGVAGLGVDAFIDASGATSAVVAGIAAVRGGGTVVLAGAGADEIAVPIRRSRAGSSRSPGVFRYTDTWLAALDLVASGQVDLDALVTARYSLDDIEKALTAGREPGSLKTMVVPA
jgi:L-iditol 2-dehydrogenase